MSGLDWEKQKRKEQLLESADPGHMRAISKHVAKRKAAQRHRERTFIRGVEKGVAQERERIVDWLMNEDKPNRNPCAHSNGNPTCCGNCNVWLDPKDVIQFVKGWK
jgi:hypothetical protein